MKMDERVRRDSVLHLTLTQTLAGAFALVVAVAGATFTIARLATESQVSALQLQAAQLDTRVRELQAELQRRQLSLATTAQDGRSSTPSASAEPGLSIVLKTPAAESEVPQFVDVSYTVVGAVPAGYAPVLFVKDPLGQYWSWSVSTSGFYPAVQLGVATDVGRRFEIGVLVTREKPPINKSLTNLPSGIVYEAISVKRK
jgi:hypothetical protein